MADFVRLWRKRHEVLEDLDALIEAANEAKDRECQAAINIQRVFRGARDRYAITLKARACVEIERVFRGHCGRERARAAREQRAATEESGVFQYYATVIQRAFKGYYSRTYVHDFFARKAYIESIKQKSEELRDQLSGHMEQQIEAEQDRAEAAARDEFKKVTQNLHHLLSTASTPGVYNPPYAQGMVPTAFNVPIEDHLRDGVKDLLRTQGLKRVRATTYTAQSRLSVQASSKYGVVEEHAKTEKRYSRLRHLSARPFVAGAKTKHKPIKPGVTLGTPYEEPWRVARSVRELQHLPEEKAKRVADQPFHTTVVNNRVFEEYERRKHSDSASFGSRRGMGSSRRSRARTTGALSTTKRSQTLASEHTPY